jgi:hypothetical protein
MHGNPDCPAMRTTSLRVGPGSCLTRRWTLQRLPTTASSFTKFQRVRPRRSCQSNYRTTLSWRRSFKCSYLPSISRS